MNKRIGRFLFVMMITLPFLMGMPYAVETTALAQGVIEVSIEPGVSTIPTGASAEVRVNISNAVDLNAYDLKIVYDAEVVVLESWSHGGFLSNVSVVFREEVPGTLRLAVTQLASPGVTGSGTLLTLKFKGNKPGGSAIDILDAQLANKSNEKILPNTISGVINVSNQVSPSVTNTATYTHTPTLTNTATSTHTPTMTLTSTMNPLVTWTATRTRTPTAVTGRTITPIRAIVITRTGTPGTAVVVPPGALPGTPTPPPRNNDQAGGPVGEVTPAEPTPAGGETELTLLPSANQVTVEASGISPEKVEGKVMDEIINRINKSNSLIWGIGFFILFVIAGLVVMFIKLWRRM